LAAAGTLPETVPILHAGPGCAGNFAWTNNGAAALNVTGPCISLSVPATNLQEGEVVFGGLERLREEIDETLKIMEGNLYFVITGCLPEVIGDDVASLVTEFRGKKVPIVLASTPGFKGDSYLGYGEVLNTLVKNVIKKGTPLNNKLVNIWGVPPFFDPFWRGNLLGLKELISSLGFEANVFFGPEAKLSTIKKAGGAVLNILVSGLYGLDAAELFYEIHGIQYINAPLPFGTGASERFLQIVGRALKVPKNKIKKAIEEQRARRYAYLEPIVDVYNDMEAQRHVLIVGDANYALALSDFFAEDLGWIPELAVVTNSLNPEDKEKLLAFHKEIGGPGPERLIFEHRADAIGNAAKDIWNGNGQKYFNSRQPIFVAGSSLERALAQDLGAAHLSLSYPISNRAVLSKGFTGYFGGLELTEDLLSACIAGR
jgi:nitrogenase molybdenum-iron protein beta chain